MSALYLKHFDLEKSPFQITPDIDFFFSGSQRGGMLTALLHVACHEEGIVTAVAEVGSGKTLLARLMLSRLPEDISTVYLANPCFSRDEIISAISRDLGLTGQATSTEENLAQLHQELLRRHSLGQRVLLVIDEAHAMPPESLEEVRLLSNLETDRHKLVNIMLFGQPELDTLLQDRRLRQVRDRVIHRFELPPLPKDEALAYIDHRLRIAGWRGGRLFTAGALNHLLKASQGRARRINLLADKSLLAAYAEGRAASRKVPRQGGLRRIACRSGCYQQICAIGMADMGSRTRTGGANRIGCSACAGLVARHASCSSRSPGLENARCRGSGGGGAETLMTFPANSRIDHLVAYNRHLANMRSPGSTRTAGRHRSPACQDRAQAHRGSAGK
jgi:MSHA biogenesis protein MshM